MLILIFIERIQHDVVLNWLSETALLVLTWFSRKAYYFLWTDFLNFEITIHIVYLLNSSKCNGLSVSETNEGISI
jgi:hypothetical protein